MTARGLPNWLVFQLVAVPGTGTDSVPPVFFTFEPPTFGTKQIRRTIKIYEPVKFLSSPATPHRSSHLTHSLSREILLTSHASADAHHSRGNSRALLSIALPSSDPGRPLVATEKPDFLESRGGKHGETCLIECLLSPHPFGNKTNFRRLSNVKVRVRARSLSRCDHVHHRVVVGG